MAPRTSLCIEGKNIWYLPICIAMQAHNGHRPEGSIQRAVADQTNLQAIVQRQCI